MTHEEDQRQVSRPTASDSERNETPNGPELERWRMSRRRFLVTSASTGALASVGTIAGVAHAQDATPTAATPSAGTPSAMSNMPGMGTPEAGGAVNPLADGFVHFAPPDANVIIAAAARLIPTDANGPGATEAGVVFFIDRQLAKTHMGYTGPIYDQGPWLEGLATQGDQSALSVADRFRLGIAGMDAYAQQLYKAGFANLTGEQQDRILGDMEKGKPDTFDGASIQSFPPVYIGSGTEGIQSAGAAGIGAAAFFSLLLQYVMAGFFADPVHGGNRDMVGWKLVGFPGAQGFVYNDWILRYGEEFTGGYKSLAEYQQQVGGGR